MTHVEVPATINAVTPKKQAVEMLEAYLNRQHVSSPNAKAANGRSSVKGSAARERLSNVKRSSATKGWRPKTPDQCKTPEKKQQTSQKPF